MNRRNSGTPDDIHSSQRRAPSRHITSSGQLDVALIVMGPDRSTTVRRIRPTAAQSNRSAAANSRGIESPNCPFEVAGRRPPVRPPSRQPSHHTDVFRRQRLIRQHGIRAGPVPPGAVRRECQLAGVRTTRLAASPRAAGERLAPLDSSDLAGRQRPFLPACAAAPRPHGFAMDDRHLGAHRAEGVAELATGGELEVETGGHL